MKKFDLSSLVISDIRDIYTYTLEEETRASGLTDACVLLLRQSGRSVYRTGSERHTLDKDNLLFLPAGTRYEMEVVEEGPCTVIEFSAAATEKSPAPCSLFADEDGEIATLAKNLETYWRLRGPAYLSKCLSELYGLITAISTVNAYTDSLVGKYHLIHKSVKYMEKNYRRQDLYTPMLAQMSGIGETYYRNIFLAVFHTPPTRYLQKIRIDRARELLVASDATMDQIARATGFANASYFCKVFKSVTGMTPSAFVEKSRRLG